MKKKQKQAPGWNPEGPITRPRGFQRLQADPLPGLDAPSTDALDPDMEEEQTNKEKKTNKETKTKTNKEKKQTTNQPNKQNLDEENLRNHHN